MNLTQVQKKSLTLSNWTVQIGQVLESTLVFIFVLILLSQTRCVEQDTEHPFLKNLRLQMFLFKLHTYLLSSSTKICGYTCFCSSFSLIISSQVAIHVASSHLFVFETRLRHLISFAWTDSKTPMSRPIQSQERTRRAIKKLVSALCLEQRSCELLRSSHNDSRVNQRSCKPQKCIHSEDLW